MPSPPKNWPLPKAFSQSASLSPDQWGSGLEAESGLHLSGPPSTRQDGETALQFLSRPLLPRSLGAEIWAVASGLKPAGRAILFDSTDLDRMKNFCAQQNLATLQAQLPVRSSHLVVGEQQDHRGGELFFYGQNAATLERLLHLDEVILRAETKAETFAPSEEHGHLLGYPPCCVKTFVYGAEAGENRSIKALWHQQDGGTGWWPLNVLNQIGPVLLGYYPCSLKCTASLAFANKVMSLPEVRKVMADPRFERALSGVFYYWLDRLQFWHPKGRPDLAVHCQMLADGAASPPFSDPVDFFFSASVIAPFRRATAIKVDAGKLLLHLPEGELLISHPTLPLLRFEMENPPQS